MTVSRILFLAALVAVTSSVNGKLLPLSKPKFFKFESSEDIWADFVNHEVDFSGGNDIIAVFNINESLAQNQKIDQEYLEHERKITFIKSNFSNPLAMDLSSSFRSSSNKEVPTYFLIHPHQFGEDSACIYSLGLKLQKLDTKREQNLNLNYEKKGQAEWVCVGPLNQARGFHLNISLGVSDASGKTENIRLYLNPKVSVSYKLVMVLQNIQSLGTLIRFVQVDLNNPSARLIQFNEIPKSSLPRFIPGNMPTVLLAFESDLPFSNETLQLIANCCDSSDYRKDGLFQVAPRKLANTVVPASEDYSFWNRSGCSIQAKMISKTEHPQTNVELFLSKSLPKDEEQNAGWRTGTKESSSRPPVRMVTCPDYPSCPSCPSRPRCSSFPFCPSCPSCPSCPFVRTPTCPFCPPFPPLPEKNHNNEKSHSDESNRGEDSLMEIVKIQGLKDMHKLNKLGEVLTKLVVKEMQEDFG